MKHHHCGKQQPPPPNPAPENPPNPTSHQLERPPRAGMSPQSYEIRQPQRTAKLLRGHSLLRHASHATRRTMAYSTKVRTVASEHASGSACSWRAAPALAPQPRCCCRRSVRPSNMACTHAWRR
jgi:hypothetical protein